jgi:hypothetical protein
VPYGRYYHQQEGEQLVDRGESPNHTLRRVLMHFFERGDPAFEPWLDEHANIVLGILQPLGREPSAHTGGTRGIRARGSWVIIQGDVSTKDVAVGAVVLVVLLLAAGVLLSRLNLQ